MFVILHNLTDLSKRVKLGNVIADAVSRMCVPCSFRFRLSVLIKGLPTLSLLRLMHNATLLNNHHRERQERKKIVVDSSSPLYALVHLVLFSSSLLFYSALSLGRLSTEI